MGTKKITVLLLAALVVSCASTKRSPSAEVQVRPSHRTTLSEGISQLPVAEDQKAVRYDRGAFPHWTDVDGDGCNARKDVLLSEAMARPKISGHCTLIGGTWYSYYDGATINDARDMTVDHMVPLADAWRSGAYRWDEDTRTRFANDTGQSSSLVGVTAAANTDKSDQDPAHWLPAHQRCRYFAEWTATKLRWGLTADPTEKEALQSQAKGCPDAPLTWQLAVVRTMNPDLRTQ